MLKYFNFNNVTNPRVIAFDFHKTRYHIDPISYSDNTTNVQNLEILLKKFDANELKLTSGGYVYDFFYMIGIELSLANIIIMIALFFLLVIIGLVALHLHYEKKEKKKVAMEIGKFEPIPQRPKTS